ncbi:MAG: PAS domain-containing sensor histidine kinase [Ignavibacteriaceae bacterium]|nr:PAS domain-containing sensor histidine kinase [Ignavibacteriaceae bacterium]
MHELIEILTRTVNSLLNDEINKEISTVNLKNIDNDELCKLAASIQKLNDKFIRIKEQASDISPGEKVNTSAKESAASKENTHLNNQISGKNKFDEINNLSNLAQSGLFGQMEKAFALFEILYDENGKPYDYVFLEVNEYFEKATGLKLNDIIGKRVDNVFRAISKLWRDTSNLVAIDGVTRQVEYFSQEFDRYIDIIIFRTNQGNIATITTDVTKWKENEKRLKLFAYVLQSISEYVSLTDMHDNLIFVNKAFANAYGYNEKELLGKPISIVRPEPQQEGNNNILAKTMENGGWSGYLWNKRKDSTSFYIKLFTSIVKDDSNNPVAFVGVARDVTAQKNVRDSLKNYVSLLNATLNATVDGIVVVNLNGKIEIHNKQFLTMWGLSSEALSSNGVEYLASYISGLLENYEDYRAKIKILNSTPEESSFDTLILKDGRIIEMISQPQMAGRKPVGRVWSFRDVTKYQRLNLELLKSQTKISLAMELVKLAHWEYDVVNNIFIFNDNFYELYGTSIEKEGSYIMSPEAYIQKFVYPDDVNIAANEVRNAILYETKNVTRRSEHRIIRGDGQVRNIIVQFVTERDGNGKVIKTYGANQDITEVKKTFEALLKSETKYRKIFEYINDVFYETDANGIMVEISPSIQRLTGYTKEELIGQPATIIYFDPADRKQLINKITANEYVMDFEVTMKNIFGNPVYVSVSSHIIYDEKGNYAGIEGSMRDISERKKSEEEIKKKNDELKELIATKDKFFSIIAHDLKSPFQGLLGYTDLLSNEFDSLSEKEKLEFVKSINNLSKGAYILLENLLRWARLQTGKIIFNTDFFNLFEALKSTIFLMEDSAKKKDIKIHSSIDRKIFVIADLDMLQTIIRNIVSNSLKFTNPGGNIFIAAEDLGNIIKISVEDTGVGMSKEKVQKLFKIEESFSTKGTMNEEGTGLGLLLCKEMIDMHKGKIWAESEPGKGTKFFITIPSDRNY